ncbi:MAG: matrixin family metalloprotease [Pseudomonadota bacterium]
MEFDLLGAKWGATTLGTPSGTVTWAADLSGGLNFNGAVHDQAAFDAALEDAFEAWERVASVNFVQSGSVAMADISVVMGDLSSEPANVVGQAAVSAVSLPGTDRLTNVDITLDNTEFWAPTGGGGIDFFAVAAHEIGHGIGLDHVNDPNQIMNPVITTDELGDGDIAGAQALYGRDAGDVAAPAPSADPFTPTTAAEADDGGGGGGGGIGLLLGGLFAALLSLFGGAAAAPALVLAGLSGDGDDDADDDHADDDHTDEDHDHDDDHDDDHDHDEADYDHDHDHDHDHDGDLSGEELIAFLDEAYEEGQTYQFVHTSGLDEDAHDHDHDFLI